MNGSADNTPDLAVLPVDEVAATTWMLLADGVDSAGSPFHTPIIATSSDNGPVQRTVVLRHVDPAERLVICHTDRRSGKIADLALDSRMAWLVYDRERKLQVKLHGSATVHTNDAIADACWARSAARSRTCYNTPTGPGQPVPWPPPAPPPIADEAAERDARSHFAAIACRIDVIDWVHLRGAGHRRAIVQLAGGAPQSTWVTP